MKTPWLTFVSLFAVLLLAGCASDDGRVTELGTALTDLKLSNTGAQIVVRYTNEAILPVVIDKSTHKLYLNGTFVGTASTEESMGVQNLNAGSQTIPLTPANPAADEAIRAAVNAGSFEYRMDSTMTLKAYEDEWTVRHTSQGRIKAHSTAAH